MALRRTRNNVSSESSTSPFIPPTDSELNELIAARAYELYLQRATGARDDVADWLEAEKDVQATIHSLSAITISAPTRKAEKPVVPIGQKSRATRALSNSTRRNTPVQNKPA